MPERQMRESRGLTGTKYDLVVRGGRTIDPKNGIDAVMDVAIQDGRIAKTAPVIPADAAVRSVDATGQIVCPGFIDLNTHVYHIGSGYGVDPDLVSHRSLATTLVDAGSTGASNFAGFRNFVIKPAKTRILAFLNVSFSGIFAFDPEISVGEASIRALLAPARCAEIIERNRDILVGVKVRIAGPTSGDIGMEALDLAIEAGERCGLPVMVHVGKPPPSYAEIVSRLRPGDIVTHCFRPAPNAPTDDEGNVLDALLLARRRGVLFDIGHGKGAFGFASATAAVAAGFVPDVISSDVHAFCIDGPAFDVLHVMSKLMTVGITLPQAVSMMTINPARAIGRHDLGHLGIGATADISIIEETSAQYPFVDVQGKSRMGRIMKPVRAVAGGVPKDVPSQL